VWNNLKGKIFDDTDSGLVFKYNPNEPKKKLIII